MERDSIAVKKAEEAIEAVRLEAFSRVAEDVNKCMTNWRARVQTAPSEAKTTPCPHCGNSDEVEVDKGSGLCRSCGGEWVALYEEIPRSLKLGDCLAEAKATICGERQDQYGNPEDSFALVAKYWSTYLIEVQKKVLIAHGFDPAEYKLVDLLTSLDVDHMMILFKVARCQGQKPKRDNYVDICGYAAIAADRLMEEK